MKIISIFFTIIFCISLPTSAMYRAAFMRPTSFSQKAALSQKRFSSSDHPLNSKIKQECERLKTEIPAAYAARAGCTNWQLSKQPVPKDDGYCSKKGICECDEQILGNIKAVERLLAFEHLITKMNPIVFTVESEEPSKDKGYGK